MGMLRQLTMTAGLQSVGWKKCKKAVQFAERSSQGR